MKPTPARRGSRIRWIWVLALSIAALALLPVDSLAQGNSPITPAAEKSKGKGGQEDEGTAPVPEPSTWATMITLAVVGGGLAYRSLRKRRVAP